MAKDFEFLEAKETVIENLGAIKLNLEECVADGMVDSEDHFYNEILLFSDQAADAETWDELMEVISKAKTLEVDVAAWLSLHGASSLSLPWPKKG